MQVRPGMQMAQLPPSLPQPFEAIPGWQLPARSQQPLQRASLQVG
jgi:hypothetical protein